MKQLKLVTALLVMLMILGWIAALLGVGGKDMEQYQVHLDQAQAYIDRGLYQKAIEEFDGALAIESSEEVWTKKLDAYTHCLDVNKGVFGQYLQAANQAVNLYPRSLSFTRILCDLYTSNQDAYSAYQVAKRAMENGIEDPELEELYMKIKYAYSTDWKVYDEVYDCIYSRMAVNENGVWSYIGADGRECDMEKLKFAGPVGQDGVRVITDDTRSCLMDSAGVIQGILQFVPQKAGRYAEGLIPIYDGETWSYYNLLGDKQFGGYDEAGAFCNGQAAVRKGGKWMLVDRAGKSGESYDDIVLQRDGSHVSQGIMIAKKGGIYRFYSEEGAVGGFSGADRLNSDNLIAVEKDGKWGFTDQKGNMVLKPAWTQARSFSGGLAAVSNGEFWGFINRNGTLVIDYKFLDVGYFTEMGCCPVKEAPAGWQIITLNILEE